MPGQQREDGSKRAGYYKITAKGMEAVWPGSTVCMERDGVAAWLDEVQKVFMWIAHPSDGKLTLMDFGRVEKDRPRWWEWDETYEKWRIQPELGVIPPHATGKKT